ncbi:hypothetical protein EMIHUDRAFT_222043 [Emiliania huxleyi CCMP1516]|uniref:RAP domain-containing protein n=2 Tax=Emiliania huxleyi TaxID=2903 RepID=A0A0D3KZ22_EMIH1|nr:hypothetical protein EMIHUDRAFT_222043 [Emiliania huxleyi CCMP1516]EOD41007.1 hypothetical protein EMIHUDRAFT_222043 [Emiliania huxleyi CCMP1516]|eukprot:XP_005793436.1 hypothetical protein EMIHUDRAFT_222043 [Emiliania huxleyi CCMP1516]
MPRHSYPPPHGTHQQLQYSLPPEHSGSGRPRDESLDHSSWRRDEQQSSDARIRVEPSRSAAGGQCNAKQLNNRISDASGTEELLTLFAAHSTGLDHIHAGNLWNKLGKQNIERRHEEQLEQLVRRTLDLVSSCEARTLSNIAHGVAKCRLPASVDPSGWSSEHHSQLHQWQLWLSLERGEDGQQYLLPDSQRQLCRDAMVANLARPSGLQRSVAAALTSVQHGFEEECLEPLTGYSLDLAIPSTRIAIEVDGPFHFLLPDGRGVRRPNGPTLLKRRLLAAAGWRVISVPFFEWDALPTASERQTYLERAVALSE